MKSRGVLIVLSGFSGAGKGTLVKRLMSDYDNYALSISMTTRAPRPGEEHGREYFFVTKEAFEETIANDGLLEYANYVGNYYGTPMAYVEEQLAAGKDVILEIEIQGALQVKKRFPEALLLFVSAPSAEALRERLIGRGTESAEVIEKRLRRATEESEGIEEYEYLIINDDLDQCVAQTHETIQCAKTRADRNIDFIEKMRQELKDISKGEK